MDITLRPLSVNDGSDIYEMLQKIPAKENGYINSQHGISYEEYKAWLIRAEADARKTEIEDGWRVPQSTYWLYVNGYPVGVAKLRHFLTDKLCEEGGHIGYAIRPCQRGKGYGKALLRLLLPHGKEHGIDHALITVQNDNAVSIRVALQNGGRIEKANNIRHYIWIDC